jgi:hypothetical protein
MYLHTPGYYAAFLDIDIEELLSSYRMESGQFLFTIE